MHRHRYGTDRRWLAIVTLAMTTLAVASPVQAADDALLAAQLASGEFAPALGAADQLADPAARDRWYQAIAVSQQRSGARSASLATTAKIGDDRTRTATLDRLAIEAQGGGIEPDFEGLMSLITQTIAPISWADVGGQGAIKPFPGGVYVDAQGALQRNERTDASLEVILARHEPPATVERASARRSTLRKVSLPRLEREVQLRLAAGRPLDEDMLTLAGIERVQYVLVYPETGDLVLAGPAGDWQVGPEDRLVSVDSGRPVLRLDDLVMLLRHMATADDTAFGCSITPTQESLARTKSFAEVSSRRPIKAGGRDVWLEQLRSKLGPQEIEVYGIDGHSRAAQVLVEADYRMKLVGIGLEDGVFGMSGYFDGLQLAADEELPPMDVLRWWFTLDYDAVAASPDRRAFELRGQGVRVLSENELLTATGQRVHTGASDIRNQQFAHEFTEHFAALAEKYPVYAELQNVFDLALVATLVRNGQLAEQVGWHLTCFGDAQRFPLPEGTVPQTVETVINHRVLNKTQIVAVVSGGVAARPDEYASPESLTTDAELGGVSLKQTPHDVSARGWWWD